MSNQKFNNALVVGCGGTGVKTLRFLKGMTQFDQSLGDMLKLGDIELVTIDTDPKANDSEMQVDPKLVYHAGASEAQQEKFPHILPTIDTWVQVRREEINNALPRVVEDVRRINESGVPWKQWNPQDLYHHHIAAWFPVSDPEKGIQLTVGHSRNAGAAQWRPLGRIGVFQAYPEIKMALKTAHTKVKRRSPEERVRAFLVCSLAGGTGSGMFWDIAFILHTIDPGIQLTGIFLLDGPFVSVDKARRIAPNVYGALKELANYKNWLQKDHYSITYPDGTSFEASAGDDPVFDSIYLYQSFPPGDGVRDPNEATIDATCLRLAQNIIAQMRNDLHRAMDIGKNNVNGDANVQPHQREARFVFSTSSSTSFPDTSFSEIKRHLQHEWLNRQVMAIALGKAYDYKSLVEKLGMQWQENMLENPFEEEIKRVKQTFLDDSPASSKGFKERIRLGQKELDDLSKEQYNEDRLHTVFEEALGVELLRDWVRRTLEEEDPNTPIVAQGKDIGKEVAEAVNGRMDQLEDALKGILTEMTTGRRELDDKARAFLAYMRQSLDRLEKTSNVQKRLLYPIIVPKDFHRVKYQFGARSNSLSPVQNARWKLSRKHIPLDGKRRVLSRILEQLSSPSSHQEREFIKDLESFIEDSFTRKSEQVRVAIDAILDGNKKIREGGEPRKQFVNALKATKDTNLELPSAPRALEFYTGLRSLSRHANDKQKRYHWESKVELLEIRIKNVIAQRAHNLRIDDALVDVLKSKVKLLPHLQKVRDLLDGRNVEANDLHRHVIDAVEQCHPSVQRVFEWEDEAASLVGWGLAVLKEITDFITEQTYWLTMLVEMDDGARATVRKCRTRVFSDGIIGNTLRLTNLVIIPPPQTYFEQEEKEIHNQFRLAALTELGMEPKVTNNLNGHGAIIFYEDLFHPADEIERIQDYFQSYTSKSKAERPFYHFDRRAADLREIVLVRASALPVHCGNEGCTRDIRLQDRTEIICPSCKGAIWNRCGNPNCTADNLQTLFSTRFSGNNHQETSPPYKCPECGGDLKTYWWTCDDPEHKYYIPADKESCPQCLEEHRMGSRSYDKIGRRQATAEKECPGCIQIADQIKRPHRIPRRLKQFYEDGVNGHDSLTFRRIIREEKMDAHFCLEMKVHHMLYPTCPKTDELTNERHHLFRNRSGHFQCPQHPDLHFYRCYHCDYPIQVDGHVITLGERHSCPRCMRELQKCPFCSDKQNQLFSPYEKYPNFPRCPCCTNLMIPDQSNDVRLVERELQKAAYCRNLFNCPASFSIWGTAAEYDLDDCRCCAAPASKLLDRADLAGQVEDCPFCLSILGTPASAGQERLFGSKMVSYVDGRLENWKRNTGDLKNHRIIQNHVCPVCGTKPLDVLYWMLKGGFLRDDENGEQLKNGFENRLNRITNSYKPSFPDGLSFANAKEFYDTLRRNPDNAGAFKHLKREILKHAVTSGMENDQRRINQPYRSMVQNVLAIFKRDSIAAKGLEQRLLNMEQMWLENFRRENQTSDYYPISNAPRPPRQNGQSGDNSC